MSERFELDETVTLSSSVITKRDLASIGITEETEFTIEEIIPGDVGTGTVFFLRDEDGNTGYYVKENDLLGV